jgi:hypothetical protein
MRKSKLGWTILLAATLAMPSLRAAVAADKAEKADTSASASKEDQDKMKEHMKLRTEIKKVKYPASKATIVSKVKGIKPDDKKWFTETLPEKTYTSSDEVYSALGWEATPPPSASK